MMRLTMIVLVIICLISVQNIAVGQINSDFEIITSENFSRISMLEEIGSSEEPNSVTSLEFNSTSNLLAYETLRELGFWNIYEQSLEWRIPVISGSKVRFASDGTPLVVASANFSLYVWPDVTNSSDWINFRPNTLNVGRDYRDIRIVGEGENQEIIAVTWGNFGIFRWRVSTGMPVFEVYEPAQDEFSQVLDLLLSEDGQILAIFGRTHNYLEFIDTNTAQSIGAIELLNALGVELYGDVNVNLLAFTESKHLLANVFSFGHLEDSVLAVINPDTLTLTQIEYDFDSYWLSVATSKNSDIMAFAEGLSGSVYFFDKDTIEVVGLSPITHTDISVVAFSPDGKFIATGDFNGLVRLWGIPSE